MKKIKHIVSILLCLTMLLSSLQISVLAVSNEEDFSYDYLINTGIKLS